MRQLRHRVCAPGRVLQQAQQQRQQRRCEDGQGVRQCERARRRRSTAGGRLSVSAECDGVGVGHHDPHPFLVATDECSGVVTARCTSLQGP